MATAPRHIVPAGWWQAAEPLGEFAYVGATVGPGFEFADFAFARDHLLVMEAIAQLSPALTRLAGPPKTMTTPQPRNPLHGITLEAMLNALVAHFGWPGLGEQIHIRCFVIDPSVASSLKFLRKTPWAREKVESPLPFHAA